MNGGFTADPEGLVKKGDSVNEIYQNYVGAKNAIYKAAHEVRDAWVGADSTGYVSAIDSYEADFKKLGDILEQMSQIMRRHGMRLIDSRDALKATAAKL